MHQNKLHFGMVSCVFPLTRTLNAECVHTWELKKKKKKGCLGSHDGINQKKTTLKKKKLWHFKLLKEDPVQFCSEKRSGMCSRSTFWLSLRGNVWDGLAGDESVSVDVGISFVCLSFGYKGFRLNVGSKWMFRRTSNGLHMIKCICSYCVCICAQKEKYLVNHSCFSPSVPLGSR